MRASSRRGTVLGIVVVLSGIFAVSSVTDTGSAPPRPSWVDADGRGDFSKMPARIGVVGPNGETIGYVDKNDLNADPLGPGRDAASIPIYASPSGSRVVGSLPMRTSGVRVFNPGFADRWSR